MRRFAGAAVTALALLQAGCGGGLWRAPESGPSEADELRRQNLELRREKTVAEVELARLRQEVARLEAALAALREEVARRVPAAGGTPRTTDADALESPPVVEEEDLADDELVPPASAPPARVPPARVPPARVPPARVPPANVPPANVPPARQSTAEPEPPAPVSVPPPQGVDAGARALYDESYALFHERRYTESEAGFERFLELYPRTDLADNAQYWIGECRFARGENEQALEAFRRTVEAYPEGNKVPDALLKAGRCLERLGDRQAATATYEEIVRRFGASAAAAAARERLAELH